MRVLFALLLLPLLSFPYKPGRWWWSTGGAAKGVLVKVMEALLIVAAASGIGPMIKESSK